MSIQKNGASIAQKILIRGRIHLDSPLLIGAGKGSEDPDHIVDTPIMRGYGNRPMIPGTSLAGVLRSALGIQESGCEERLFGCMAETEDSSWQSLADVSDIVFTDSVGVAHRDGVAIDAVAGTAKTGKKYNFEVLERGASANLEIILTVREAQKNKILDKDIKRLVDMLKSGFKLGAGTAKGLGKVHCAPVCAVWYDFEKDEAIEAWLKRDSDSLQNIDKWKHSIQNKLNFYEGKEEKVYNPNDFIIDADFDLTSSLLVRKGSAEMKDGSSVTVMQKSREEYLIPGSSLKGVLRQHAAYVLSLFGRDESFLNDMMGFAKEENHEGKKSRLFVEEVYINPEDVLARKQSRNSIDRFTGGTIKEMLLTEEPIWKTGDNRNVPISMHFGLQDCSEEWEAGLMLFLLRDLWDGRIAIGGDKAIGRGTLKGCRAAVHYKRGSFEILEDGTVTGTDVSILDKWAKSFYDYMMQKDR